MGHTCESCITVSRLTFRGRPNGDQKVVSLARETVQPDRVRQGAKDRSIHYSKVEGSARIAHQAAGR